MKINLYILLVFIGFITTAQTNTEIYLFDFKQTNNSFELSNPVNISKNQGYDSQPFFTKDSKKILFSSNNNGQTDIVKYTIESKQKEVLLNTSASEYSPTPIPNTNEISYIKLEENGTQLLWKIDLKTNVETILIPDLKIGYHAWIDNNTLISFVLGTPQTLQLNNLNTKENRILGSEIGRSLHKIPGSENCSYINKSNNEYTINSFNPSTKNIEIVTKLPFQVEDIAWTPKGSIITTHNDTFYLFDAIHSTQWNEIKKTKQFEMLKGITRIAVSPDGTKIAIVVTGK
jgi:Tol biopolymer transport system component